MGGLLGVAAAGSVHAAAMRTQTVAGIEFTVPEGFAVERVVPTERTDSYVVVTFDAHGRPVVSKENDFPRRLIDRDGDGVYESEQIITERIRNAQGLWFEGETLYAIATPVLSRDEIARELAEAAMAARMPGASTLPGSGIRRAAPTRGDPTAAGLFKLTDAEGDGVAEGFETVVRLVGTMQEHGAHALRRGPDGALNFVVGNVAGTPPDAALDPATLVLGDSEVPFLPPLAEVEVGQRDGVHGAIYRLDPKTGKVGIIAGGLRNAYDFAFDLNGELFLHDSDMESDQGTPWYRGIRTVHATLGGNFGYRNGSSKVPDDVLDTLTPVRDLGRGSPVGVEFYQSYAYPQKYFDALLEADWARGTLRASTLVPQGASFTTSATLTTLLRGSPLAIIDVEVGPDGLIYFTTGGRGTAGGLWRLRYTGTAPAAPDRAGIGAVVRQPQPLSSWGWAAIARVKDEMGADAFGAALSTLARDTSAAPLDRARAVYELQRHGPTPSLDLLGALLADRVPEVRAAAVYALGMRADSGAVTMAVRGLRDPAASVKRRSAEALVRLITSGSSGETIPVAEVLAALGDEDRFVRWAVRQLLERLPRTSWQESVLTLTNPRTATEGLFAWVRTAGGVSFDAVLARQLALLGTAQSAEDELRLLRLYQVTATRMPGGVPVERRQALAAVVASRFPSPDDRLTREYARILAHAGGPAVVSQLLAALPAGDEKPLRQFELLVALAGVDEGWTPDTRRQVVAAFARAEKRLMGLSGRLYLGQLFARITAHFPAEERTQAYASVPARAPTVRR